MIPTPIRAFIQYIATGLSKTLSGLLLSGGGLLFASKRNCISINITLLVLLFHCGSIAKLLIVEPGSRRPNNTRNNPAEVFP